MQVFYRQEIDFEELQKAVTELQEAVFVHCVFRNCPDGWSGERLMEENSLFGIPLIGCHFLECHFVQKGAFKGQKISKEGKKGHFDIKSISQKELNDCLLDVDNFLLQNGTAI